MHIRHIGIVTNQIEKMIPFYEGLGFVVKSDDIEKVRIAKLKNKKGDTIELLQYESMSEDNLRKKGISHISFIQDPDRNYLEVIDMLDRFRDDPVYLHDVLESIQESQRKATK